MDDFDRLLDHWRRVVDHAAGELSTVLPRTEPVTLAYFVRDYVGHLAHHLAQIRALLPRREVL